jgi:hypothetical protein
MREVYDMERHTQRLAHGTDRERYPGGKRENEMGWMGEVLPQGPIGRRAAEEAKVLAQIWMPGNAVSASATRDGRIHDHGRPWRRALCPRPQCLDHASHFVTQDVTGWEMVSADLSVGVILQIRSTNPDRPDPDEDLAARRRGQRSFVQSNLMWADDAGDSHG